ncbi:MAG TPA: hypothetical protein VFS20_08000 [Longimicrobium sp.]|nr:hypothetical protein [Longimicrobium sp.]
MNRLTLNLEALSVESFAAAEPVAPQPALAATIANCSAIDACPSRLCTSRC